MTDEQNAIAVSARINAIEIAINVLFIRAFHGDAERFRKARKLMVDGVLFKSTAMPSVTNHLALQKATAEAVDAIFSRAAKALAID